MKKYSVFSLVRNALDYHRNWQQAWRSPAPKPAYDAIIVGGGGHGLATAYYLAKGCGVTNVAVIEKGWLGGGYAVMTLGLLRRFRARGPVLDKLVTSSAPAAP